MVKKAEAGSINFGVFDRWFHVVCCSVLNLCHFVTLRCFVCDLNFAFFKGVPLRVSFRELTFFLSLLCLNRGFKMTTGRWKSYIRRTNLMPDHFWCCQCGQGKQAQRKEEGRRGIGSEKIPPIDFMSSDHWYRIYIKLSHYPLLYPEWCWASFLDSISNQKHILFPRAFRICSMD